MNFKFIIIFFSFLIFFLFSNFVVAYNQNNTHPALTDEIVDFYNLSYPSDFISDEFKKELIKGAIEEDAEIRPLNHFYDPIYNKGFANYSSSKEWARSSEKQYASLVNYAAIFEVSPNSLENTSYGDYSYERAIKDYAMGNKKRAFRALGHTLHLLEDANVPDHTRDDPHSPIHSVFGSPYEKEMAKWSPLNTNIAKPLFDKKTKPMIFNSIEKYFDEIALYSNNYFFSKDTIGIQRYSLPKILKTAPFRDSKSYLGMGKDKDGTEFILAKLKIEKIGEIFVIKQKTLKDEEIGSLILDDYWLRLTKHLIPHGAGLVKVFLAQAQEAEKLYNERKVEEPKLSFFQKIVGAINPFGGGQQEANTQNNQIVSEIASGILNGEIAVNIQEEPKSENISTFKNSNTLLPAPTQIPQIAVLQSPNLTPSVLPSPTPTPSISPTPILTPIPTVSAFPSPTPAAITESSSCADPVLKTNSPIQNVVINEIAWMGTEASTADEWLELKNNTASEINLNCWQIIAEDGTPKIKLSSKIGAGEYYLLERTDDNTIKDIIANQTYTGALENSPAGEILKLYDKDGNLQDIVGHKDASGAVVPWYAGDNTTKSSMERRNSNTAGIDSSNWQTFSGSTRSAYDAGSNLINGTPKAQNSNPLTNYYGGGGLSSSTSTPLSSPSPLLIPSLSPTPSPTPSLLPTSTPSPTPSPTSTPTPSAGAIVINEIGWMGTGASQYAEWIEFYNTTGNNINLSEWAIFEAGGATKVISLQGIINAYGYFLIERVTPSSPDAIIDIIADVSGSFGGSGLSNSGEYLVLLDISGNTIDSINASVGWPAGCSTISNSNILPTCKSGFPYRTMERKDPNQSGNDAANWATNNGTIRNGLDADNNPINGTPKARNSISGP